MVTPIAIAERNGIEAPAKAHRAALAAGIPFWVACAFLMQESGGGRNVWGHDDTWMIGYPVMSAEVYEVYRAHRDRFGCQGVGPMQLTFGSLQDEADEHGGAWQPYANMLTAFKIIANYRARGASWHEVARRYNGAESYAVQMDARFKEWRKLLNDN